MKSKESTMTDEPFSPTNPNLQTAWDASSLSDFRKCPRYYYYRHIQLWRTKRESDDIIFGTSFHEACEVYDNARARDVPYHAACILAVRSAMEKSFNWKTENTAKNRFTLIRSLVWYFEQFKTDPFETAKKPDGSPAVELSFRIELQIKDPFGQPYILCGHIDKVVKESDYYQPLDRKSTGTTLSSKYFHRYEPNTQMSCYALAVRVLFNTPNVRVLVDAAQIAVNFTRFMRGSTGRTTAQLDEWLSDTYFWIKQAEGCAQRGEWPHNDNSCMLYGGCAFRHICSMDPASRQRFLEADFVKGERWNPLRVRGE